MIRNLQKMRKNMESTFENRANYDFHKNDSEISDDNIDMDDYQDLAYN